MYSTAPSLFQSHVVSAFEQSLSNMTQRLQQLTVSAEEKVSTVTEIVISFILFTVRRLSEREKNLSFPFICGLGKDRTLLVKVKV